MEALVAILKGYFGAQVKDEATRDCAVSQAQSWDSSRAENLFKFCCRASTEYQLAVSNEPLIKTLDPLLK